MSQMATTTHGDRVTFDLYPGVGDADIDTQDRPALPDAHGTVSAAVVFVAGAGPFRAIDPITSPTAQLVAAQGVTAVVYDRLGRGESPADGRIGLDRELAVIAELIDAAGGRAVLCGHSSGCWIALAAADAGLPVDGLLLWEPPLGPADATRSWIEEFERRLDAGELEPALEQYMKDMPPEWLEGARRSPMFAGMVAQVPSYRADGEALVWSVSLPLPELMSDLGIPVEAVAGEQTFEQMIASTAAVAAAAPNGTQMRLPGADHAWEPPAMADELVRFARAASRFR